MLLDYDKFDSVLQMGDCKMESSVGECRVKISLLDNITEWECTVEVDFRSIHLAEKSYSYSRKDAYEEAMKSMENALKEVCNDLNNIKGMLGIDEF